MLTGAVIRTLVTVRYSERVVLVAEWFASPSAMAAFWRQAEE
jgi:hypothetical protein